MKNILICLARGIEGCGCSKIAIEFNNYINSLDGYKSLVIANNDKKWGRENCHKHSIVQYSFANQLDELKAVVDSYDAMVVMSVPAKKYDDSSKDGFMALLEHAKSCGKKLVYMQFDHSIHSITRNFYADEKYQSFFSYFDLVCNHSYTNDFAIRFVQKRGIHLKKLVCRDEHINNLFGIDFDAMKHFWKPYNKKAMKTIKFIGRSAPWKGPYVFRDIHWSTLKQRGYISTLEGVELSIRAISDIFKELKPKRIVRDDVNLVVSKADVNDFNAGRYKFERNAPAYFLPPYDHDAAMERLSKNQFGIELVMLNDNLAKDVIENAMLEIVAAGTIPVFRKRWAELFTIDGKPLIDYGFEECGTVFMDESNPEQAAELMDKLAGDGEMYEKYRSIAYNFYRKYFDNSVIYKKVLEIIEGA